MRKARHLRLPYTARCTNIVASWCLLDITKERCDLVHGHLKTCTLRAERITFPLVVNLVIAKADGTLDGRSEVAIAYKVGITSFVVHWKVHLSGKCNSGRRLPCYTPAVFQHDGSVPRHLHR